MGDEAGLHDATRRQDDVDRSGAQPFGQLQCQRDLEFDGYFRVALMKGLNEGGQPGLRHDLRDADPHHAGNHFGTGDTLLYFAGELEQALCVAEELFASGRRSEEHTSELQSLMRISYAVFCLKKKNKLNTTSNV